MSNCFGTNKMALYFTKEKNVSNSNTPEVTSFTKSQSFKRSFFQLLQKLLTFANTTFRIASATSMLFYFTISKSYFINYITLFYNITNISTFIFLFDLLIKIIYILPTKII